MKNQFSLHELNERRYTSFQTKPNKLPYYVFCYLLDGEVLAEIDGQNILVSPGQFVMVPPGKLIDVKYFNNCLGYDGRFTLEFVKDAS